MRALYVLGLIQCIRVVCGHGVIFTPQTLKAAALNQDQKTFVAFHAPWCGHCKKLMPLWQKLHDDYKNDAVVTIGSVDCTVHRNLCEENEIKGFPTIKAFVNGNPVGKMHSGGRSEEILRDFIAEHKKATCSVARTDLCSIHELAIINELSSMPYQELKTNVERQNAKLKHVEETFQKKTAELQKTFEEEESFMEAAKKKIHQYISFASHFIHVIEKRNNSL